MTFTGENLFSLKVGEKSTPDESELWSTILWALGISHREKDPASLKKRQVKSALQYASVRLLVIDEFNNLSNAGKKAADSSSCSCTLRKKLKMVPPVAMSQILHRFVTRM